VKDTYVSGISTSGKIYLYILFKNVKLNNLIIIKKCFIFRKCFFNFQVLSKYFGTQSNMLEIVLIIIRKCFSSPQVSLKYF